MDAQQPGGLAVIARGPLNRGTDNVPLGLADGIVISRAHARFRTPRRQQSIRKIFRMYLIGRTEYHRMLNGILQLAHVAWPVIPHEERHGLRRNSFDQAFVLSAVDLDEMI